VTTYDLVIAGRLQTCNNF